MNNYKKEISVSKITLMTVHNVGNSSFYVYCLTPHLDDKEPEFKFKIFFLSEFIYHYKFFYTWFGPRLCPREFWFLQNPVRTMGFPTSARSGDDFPSLPLCVVVYTIKKATSHPSLCSLVTLRTHREHYYKKMWMLQPVNYILSCFFSPQCVLTFQYLLDSKTYNIHSNNKLYRNTICKYPTRCSLFYYKIFFGINQS